MVHLVGGVAIAVKADVLSFGVFAVNNATVVGFDVSWVCASAHLQGVIVIRIEEGGNTGLEFFVVRNLDDHVHISLSLLVVVPSGDFVDRGWSTEINLYPLRTWSEFDEAAIGTVGITIGNQRKFADDRSWITGGDFFVLGEVHRAFRSLEGFDDLGWIRLLKVRQLGRNWSANEHRLWEFDFDLFHFLSGDGSAESCDGSEGKGRVFHVGEGLGERAWIKADFL